MFVVKQRVGRADEVIELLFAVAHESGSGTSRQMPMPCLCVRFRGIAEVGQAIKARC